MDPKSLESLDRLGLDLVTDVTEVKRPLVDSAVGGDNREALRGVLKRNIYR